MQPTLIYRHYRERLKKCSLHGLEGRPDLQFFTYPHEPLPSLEGYLLLTLDPEAPLLSPDDRTYGLLLLDGTWRYAEKMERSLPHPLPKRSLSKKIITSYPRRQTGCPDPTRGLASVEALFVAHRLLGKPTEGLLDHYLFRDSFIQMNDKIFNL